MKQSNKLFKIIIVIVAILLLLLIGGLLLLSLSNRKPAAAFYGISEKTREVIVNNLQKTGIARKNGKEPYEIVILDDSKPLENALKSVRKIDILFVHDGLNAERIYKNIQEKDLGFIKDIALNGMSTSIKQTAPTYTDNKYINVIPSNISEVKRNEYIENNRIHTKVCAIPMLSDNFEIDVKYQNFKDSKINGINVLKDIETLSDYNKKVSRTPILFAGGDDEELINVYGALTEALCGLDKWNQAVNEIKKATDLKKKSNISVSDIAENLIKEGNALYDAHQLLKTWISAGYIPKNMIQLNKKDVKAYVYAEDTAIVFMTLEEHRTYDEKIISKYRSIYYPGATMTPKRSFTAPVIMALSLSKDSMSRKSITQLTRDLQSQLSSGTGLAPALANCSVPDKQADDARYWIAASEKPVPAMSDAAFLNKTQKAAFAAALRANLR